MNRTRWTPAAVFALGVIATAVAPRLINTAQAQDAATQAAQQAFREDKERHVPANGTGIAVVTPSGGGVYVLRDNKLYLFDARNLNLIKQRDLP
jgi:hypothetical protein